MNDHELESLLGELKTLNQTQKQIADYLRILAQPEIESHLKPLFASSIEIRAYELTNGKRSTRDIAELVNSNKDTISSLWKKWAEMGIAESTGNQKPYKARLSLVDLLASLDKPTDKNPE